MDLSTAVRAPSTAIPDSAATDGGPTDETTLESTVAALGARRRSRPRTALGEWRPVAATRDDAPRRPPNVPGRPPVPGDPPGNQPASAARASAGAPCRSTGRRSSSCSSPPPLLYLWGLGASGWANSFYSAAAQAGSEPGRRSSSAPPTPPTRSPSTSRRCALWLMALSVRSSACPRWSILVPQALRASRPVWLLHATVRRTTGSAGAGLLAGAVLALTPVAVLMFRFNNPDALLVLLLIGVGVRHPARASRGRHAPPVARARRRAGRPRPS